MKYAIFDEASGVVAKVLEPPDLEHLLLNVGEGQDYHPGDPDPDLHYWSGTGFAEYPPRPGPWARWTGSEWTDPRTAADHAANEAIQWTALRAERDRLLAECDWTDLPNARLTTKQHATWQAYRDELRDMPETTEGPANPVWPEKPTS